MYWESALSSSIEVAIAIAGFSGIIAVFGRSESEPWDIADKLRLQILLTASASSGLFSYLPFILNEAELDPSMVWRLGSGLQILWFVGAAAYRMRQAKRAGAGDGQVFLTARIIQVFALLILLAQLANVLVYATSWIYVVGVIWQLAVGFIAFASLLLNSGMRVDDN